MSGRESPPPHRPAPAGALLPRLEPLEPRALLSGAPQLPDLIPWADQSRGILYDWTIDRNSDPGHTLLRFSSAAANVGAGPLELRGGPPNGDGTQDVFQRIFNDDGSFTDRLAGKFVYHPSHNHTHFEDFASYSLRAMTSDGGVGPLVAGGTKTSFCILDSLPFGSGDPATSQYEECTPVRQGLSPGWADVYHQDLEGQSIDITSVPDGKYWLQVSVNAAGHIAESNPNNNTARILIQLGRDDSSPSVARYIGALAGSWRNSDFVGGSDPQDYYKLSVTDGLFTARLMSLRADADIQLLTRRGKLVAQSINGGTSEESMRFNLRTGTYYLRVFDAGGDTPYTLSMSIDNAGNRFSSAREIGALTGARDFSDFVGRRDTSDFYRFTTDAGGNLTALLSDLSADADIQLFSRRGKLLAQSTNGGATNDIIRLRLPPGAYFIRVFQGQGEANYTLNLSLNS